MNIRGSKIFLFIFIFTFSGTIAIKYRTKEKSFEYAYKQVNEEEPFVNLDLLYSRGGYVYIFVTSNIPFKFAYLEMKLYMGENEYKNAKIIAYSDEVTIDNIPLQERFTFVYTLNGTSANVSFSTWKKIRIELQLIELNCTTANISVSIPEYSSSKYKCEINYKEISEEVLDWINIPCNGEYTYIFFDQLKSNTSYTLETNIKDFELEVLNFKTHILIPDNSFKIESGIFDIKIKFEMIGTKYIGSCSIRIENKKEDINTTQSYTRCSNALFKNLLPSTNYTITFTLLKADYCVKVLYARTTDGVDPHNESVINIYKIFHLSSTQVTVIITSNYDYIPLKSFIAVLKYPNNTITSKSKINEGRFISFYGLSSSTDYIISIQNLVNLKATTIEISTYPTYVIGMLHYSFFNGFLVFLWDPQLQLRSNHRISVELFKQVDQNMSNTQKIIEEKYSIDSSGTVFENLQGNSTYLVNMCVLSNLSNCYKNSKKAACKSCFITKLFYPFEQLYPCGPLRLDMNSKSFILDYETPSVSNFGMINYCVFYFAIGDSIPQIPLMMDGRKKRANLSGVMWTSMLNLTTFDCLGRHEIRIHQEKILTPELYLYNYVKVAAVITFCTEETCTYSKISNFVQIGPNYYDEKIEANFDILYIITAVFIFLSIIGVLVNECRKQTPIQKNLTFMLNERIIRAGYVIMSMNWIHGMIKIQNLKAYYARYRITAFSQIRDEHKDILKDEQFERNHFEEFKYKHMNMIEHPNDFITNPLKLTYIQGVDRWRNYIIFEAKQPPNFIFYKFLAFYNIKHLVIICKDSTDQTGLSNAIFGGDKLIERSNSDYKLVFQHDGSALQNGLILHEIQYEELKTSCYVTFFDLSNQNWIRLFEQNDDYFSYINNMNEPDEKMAIVYNNCKSEAGIFATIDYNFCRKRAGLSDFDIKEYVEKIRIHDAQYFNSHSDYRMVYDVLNEMHYMIE